MRWLALVVAVLVANDAPAKGYKFFSSYFRAYLEEVASASLPSDAFESVAVIGKVKKEGVVPFEDFMKATKAIELAGDFDLWADKRHVGLWRNAEGRFYTVDITAVIQHESGAWDPYLQKGDIVVVVGRHM